MRRDTSRVSCSLNWAGALRSELSIIIATSALLRAGRLLVPAKITSSMSAARIALWDDSPMTQRSASTRFDLPQPLGPTTPVSPGSIRKSVGSTANFPRGQAAARIVKDLAPKGWVEARVPHRRKNEEARVIRQQEGDNA